MGTFFVALLGIVASVATSVISGNLEADAAEEAQKRREGILNKQQADAKTRRDKMDDLSKRDSNIRHLARNREKRLRATKLSRQRSLGGGSSSRGSTASPVSPVADLERSAQRIVDKPDPLKKRGLTPGQGDNIIGGLGVASDIGTGIFNAASASNAQTALEQQQDSDRKRREQEESERFNIALGSKTRNVDDKAKDFLQQDLNLATLGSRQSTFGRDVIGVLRKNFSGGVTTNA